MELVPSSVSPEDALEWYFDHYIACVTQTTVTTASVDKVPTTQEEEKQKEETEAKKLLLPKEQDKKVIDSTSQNATVHAAEHLPVITNVVAKVNLGCELNLRTIAHCGRNVIYKPGSFKNLFMKLKSPRANAIIFSSGTMTCNGVVSVEDSRKAARRIARQLQKMGFPVRFLNFKITNIAASVKLFPISLQRLWMVEPRRCSYEPELFNGLFMYLRKHIRACVFATGTVTLTGSNCMSKLLQAYRKIYPRLCQSRILRR